MPINPRFAEYFHENFFVGKEEEFQEFLHSLEKHISRTIRIKPGKEEMVKNHLEEYGFILTKTPISNVFSIERKDDFDPLERRIGFTVDHLIGNFYIQELAAATSVSVLSEGKIHNDQFMILDMAASPGGKTTQLAEHYPNSFIIANEPTRERIPQLLQNLDRMGSANIGVTLYPGQYFRNTPEVFDKILLDAPCSGEGTLYKGTDATKHWHIKNIKTIARLQEKLIDAAIIALKVGGELLYSTCSMNLLENEGVLESIKDKYPGTFDIISEKRFWPHKDGTGGFFVAKLIKKASIELEEKESRIQSVNDEIKTYKSHTNGLETIEGITLYEHNGKILALKKHPELDNLKKRFYFMRFGERIGRIDHGNIIFDPFSHRYFKNDFLEYTIDNEIGLDAYLRGEPLITQEKKDGIYIIKFQENVISIEEIIETKMSNNFPHDWRRK